jgi:prepilin-type N-terminal cleavage/methylation domain-containing protein
VKYLCVGIDSFRKIPQNGAEQAVQAGNWKMKLQPKTRGGNGFTLIELLVVIFVIAVVAVLVLPVLARAQHQIRNPTCVANLKQIGLCFKVWAGDNGDKYPMQVSVTNRGALELALNGDVAGIFRAMSNELNTPKVLVCPQDTERATATNFTTDFNNSKISYFVGVDAMNNHPQMFLSGDDNFSVAGVPVKSGLLQIATNSTVAWTSGRHVSDNSLFWTPARNKFVGCIGFADGSVRWQVTGTNLQLALYSTGVATNRLVIP